MHQPGNRPLASRSAIHWIALLGSLALVSLAATGCDGDSSPKLTDRPCLVDRGFPYPPTVPYVGVHAGPGNSDYVPCDASPTYTRLWHALEGYAIAQPNTFSPDGQVTYVTTSQPAAGDCNLHALRVQDGEVLWCLSFDTSTVGSAVEVDLDGYLYLTTGEAIVSLHDDGTPRWTHTLPPRGDGEPVGAVGLHFTPDGLIATITDDGTVMLLSRADGAERAHLSVPGTYGFVPPASLGSSVDLADSLPPEVLADFASLQYGDSGSLIGTFAGAGHFSDNTVGVSPDGTLYAVGGGPSEDQGALVQVLVGGTTDDPTLIPGWALILDHSSASSPSISPDGRFVKVSDGNEPSTFLSPGTADAHTRLVDIQACDDNTDADPDPDRCADAYAVPLLSGPIMGATPLLDDRIHYSFEIQLADLLNTTRPDLRAFQGDTLLWETLLPDDDQWSSVITVTRQYLIGTATRFTDSGETLLTVELPATAKSHLVVVDRLTGEVVFTAPTTDDSSSTITIGPDGSLYVTQLCLLHSVALQTRPVGGILRFGPTG